VRGQNAKAESLLCGILLFSVIDNPDAVSQWTKNDRNFLRGIISRRILNFKMSWNRLLSKYSYVVDFAAFRQKQK
jgi:hypothetical protein